MKCEKMLCVLVPLKHYPNSSSTIFRKCIRSCSSSAAVENHVDTINYNKGNTSLENDKFRVLELTRAKFERRPRKNWNEAYFKQPRAERQSVTQDWGSTWPGPRMFHPASIPLPVRMGYPHKKSPAPDKWANTELMKIPNFFHLTPPVIKRQCKAIKKFCTDWPEGLNTEEEQISHFPVTVTSSQYLHASTTLRDLRARVVTIKVPLHCLSLDAHGKDKMLRLVGPRYDRKTDVLTLTADRCPISKQNFEYCIYLLTVIYNESMKQELWEHEKIMADSEFLNLEDSLLAKNITFIEENLGIKIEENAKKEYTEAVLKLHNEGEDEESLEKYRKAVLNLAYFK